MKKVIIVLFFFVLILNISNSNKEYLIPNEAIRFRIIANSNNIEDQSIKLELKNNIENILANSMLSVSNKEEAVDSLKNNIPTIKNMINNYNINYDINYGYNFFPEKTYKGVKYEEGYYESLVVTLGNAKGDNWWCLLFPPLCYIDEDSVSNNDYRLFVKDFIEKYM